MDEEFWEKKCIIYLIRNKIDGKGYVGQTRNMLKTRIAHHKKYNQSYLGSAIKIYGWENFSVEILEECAAPDELNKREIFWIKTLDTKFPNGYNLTDGGDTPKGRVVSDKERKIRAEINPYKRPVRCIETGEIFQSVTAAARFFYIDHTNISAVCQGRQMTSAGHRFEYLDSPLSEESKNRQPKSIGKKIRCLDTNETFNSITEAAAHFEISATGITRVCKGNLLTIHGLKFEYLDDNLREKAELNKSNRPAPCKKPVVCVETGKIFESVTAAAKFAKVPATNITAVCKGKSLTSGGFHWDYVDAEKRAAAEITRKKTTRQKKPVRCLETNTVYPSIKAASEKTGIGIESISNVCRHKAKTAGKYHWEFVRAEED